MYIAPFEVLESTGLLVLPLGIVILGASIIKALPIG
jgi:hypothetical protein